jgi:hypothetical protein
MRYHSDIAVLIKRFSKGNDNVAFVSADSLDLQECMITLGSRFEKVDVSTLTRRLKYIAKKEGESEKGPRARYSYMISLHSIRITRKSHILCQRCLRLNQLTIKDVLS